MFPYRDENPTERFPIVVILLIIVNIAAWFGFQKMGMDEAAMASALCDWGLIPGEITGLAYGRVRPITQHFVCVVDPVPTYLTLLSMQFVHGGWMHLIGNMLFLWVFGNNIEDATGPIRFVVFYLLCGLMAAVVQIASDPASTVPAVGASGAVSGVMGAYLLLFPTARVWMVVPIFFYPLRFALPAWFYLIYWGLLQFLSGVSELATRVVSGVPQSGIAFWAHIGGFVAGMFFIRFFVDRDYLARRRRRERFYPG